jgi:hypothetical protein
VVGIPIFRSRRHLGVDVRSRLLGDYGRGARLSAFDLKPHCEQHENTNAAGRLRPVTKERRPMNNKMLTIHAASRSCGTIV